jgi:general secretion pathway protein M
MMASLTRWWLALSGREKRLVGVAGALAAAVLLWLILRPLVGYIAGLGDQHRLAVERAARVEAKAALLKGDGAPVATAVTGPLDQWLAQLEGQGLVIDRLSLTPGTDGSVGLTAEVRRP